MTSVTFRNMEWQRVLSLAAKAKLTGIEWGGDVHVPPGNRNITREIRTVTRNAGLSILSYGSYYRAAESVDFDSVIMTCKELGSSRLRIWTGTRSLGTAFRSVADDLRLCCDKASHHGITLVCEYHNNTFSDSAENTLELINAVERENFRTGYQPNPYLSDSKNMKTFYQLRKWIETIHVFSWKDNIRFPLMEKRSFWQEIIANASDIPLIMEFVQNDSPEMFLRDASDLLRMIAYQKDLQ